MSMIRSAYDHRVQIFLFLEQVAKIYVRGAALVITRKHLGAIVSFDQPPRRLAPCRGALPLLSPARVAASKQRALLVAQLVRPPFYIITTLFIDIAHRNDLHIGLLADTLEGFHITPLYLQHFERIFSNNGFKSNAEVRHCIDFVTTRRQWAHVLEDARESGRLPLRPVHGDPKVNNVMIEESTGRVVKTEVLGGEGRFPTKIATTFQFDDRLKMDVPVEMREVYIGNRAR